MSSDSGTAVTIRRMRQADIAEVMVIAANLRDAPHWPDSAYAAMLEKASSPRRIALVATRDQAAGILGFAVASLLPPQAELESVAVRLDAQRQGIAGKLLEALVGELKAAAVSEFLLEVRASNHPALGLYRLLGWQQTGVRPRYYIDPIEDAILMSRELG